MTQALDCGDLSLARQAFFQLPVAVRNEPSTRYLAFKIALQSNDQALAEESIEVVARSAGKVPTYLYACALDAQQSQMRPMAIIALQAILDKKPPGAHIASILRCTARLLIAEIEASQKGIPDSADAIIEVFEVADRNKEYIRQMAPAQWMTEMQWWSKNAYNLALQLCADMDPRSLVRLLKVCQSFLSHCSDGMDVEQQNEVNHRKMTCSFLSTTALMVGGRTDTGQTSHESYRIARNHIAAFILLYRGNVRDTGGDDGDIQRARAFQMLKFDIECILKLEQWSEMRKALESCLNFEGTSRWDSLVDLLIIAKEEIIVSVPASENTVLELLQRAINATWKNEKNLGKLARWVRIAFAMSLEDGRTQFGLLLAQQAAAMAEGGQKEKHEHYPPAELHWLASTCFNRAVDFLGVSQNADAVLWMDAALEVARWADDNGSLHALLTTRRNTAQQRIEQHQTDLRNQPGQALQSGHD